MFDVRVFRVQLVVGISTGGANTLLGSLLTVRGRVTWASGPFIVDNSKVRVG